MEAWLTGTLAELDAAIRALTGVAYVAYVSDRHPLTGTDAGRYRVFLRLALTAADHAPRRPAPAAAEGGTLIDLDTVRAVRRPAGRKENPGA